MKESTRIFWGSAAATAIVLWLVAVFLLPGIPLSTLGIAFFLIFPMVYHRQVQHRAAEKELDR